MPCVNANSRRSPRRRRVGRALTGLALFVLSLVAALATTPAELLDEIRHTSVDPQRAVSLRDVDIEIGDGLLHVEDGLLLPTRPIDGRTIELVFIGQARFSIEPPDSIEAGQLELFTGRRSLDAAVEEAVLLVADQDTLARLLERPAARGLRAPLISRARRVHSEWRDGARRRTRGVEAAMFKALVGDAAFRSYFALWCRGYDLDEFVYQYDPEDVEQLTLASFTPLDVRGWDRRRLRRHIRIQQRKGRWLGVEVDDLGAWDIWLSAPRDTLAKQPSSNAGFEAESYTLDVTVKQRSLKLAGSARVAVRALHDDRRVVTFELYRDLRVQAVADGDGRSLFFFHSGGEVVVLLPEPSRAGDDLEFRLDYGGRALRWVGNKTFDLEDTANWYPHCGSVDRATYDVTLRWPKKYDMIASGRRVDGGREGGSRWERRRLDSEAIAFSFVLGEFVVETVRAGHVDLTFAFNHSSPTRLTPGLRREAIETVSRALRFFEETFGPYPRDELTVVTLPRRYSQSYLGFVTLTDSILLGTGVPAGTDRSWLRDTTIAHEVAHQWWGNLVGWWSYRDQWLSEAMANYSALLFHDRMTERDSSFLADMSAGWRNSLNRTTADGRTIESLGPIVLGGRLNSSAAGNGYRAIVYRKGAVVLAMLARTVGEQRFLEMLRSLVDVAANRVVTTASFLASIERMSGLELDGFARQYVYGTGIPEIYYDYSAGGGDEGAWVLRGEARRRSTPRYRHRIDRGDDGLWDVRRDVEPVYESPPALIVPYRLTTDVADQPLDGPGSAVADGARNGQLLMTGKRDEFEIESRHRPLLLTLDARGEILARFYARSDYPKRFERYRATDLAIEGRMGEAEQAYRRALGEELGSSGDGSDFAWMSDPERESADEDARIRLSLARLCLDQGRRDAARRELDAVERLMEPNRQMFRMERDVLHSRLEIRSGQYAPAFRRLKKTLRLAAPRREPLRWRSLLWSLRLNTERMAMTEAYALLAIAAYETGNVEELRWAFVEAKERGAEVSALEALIAAGTPAGSPPGSITTLQPPASP